MRHLCTPSLAIVLSAPALAESEAPPPEAAASSLVISTDRPSFSDGTGIESLFHLNLETGFTYTFTSVDDGNVERVNGPEILARVGLIEDRLELRLITSGYVWTRADTNGGASASTDGWSDLLLGAKLKICDQDGALPRLALGLQTSLGAGSADISTQEVEPTVKGLWSYDLRQLVSDDLAGFTLGGNVNVAWPTTLGERFTQAQVSAYLSFPIVEGTSGFFEWYVLTPAFDGGGPANYVDAGVTHLLTDRVQLDGRVGFGLSDDSDDVFVGVGISFLF
ncbi:MAG: transporter [Phycisphaerae bacterium]|nr:transporter [Phycisphaerae bacterium]